MDLDIGVGLLDKLFTLWRFATGKEDQAARRRAQRRQRDRKARFCEDLRNDALAAIQEGVQAHLLSSDARPAIRTAVTRAKASLRTHANECEDNKFFVIKSNDSVGTLQERLVWLEEQLHLLELNTENVEQVKSEWEARLRSQAAATANRKTKKKTAKKSAKKLPAKRRALKRRWKPLGTLKKATAKTKAKK